eukprot:CAMPEP_0168313394 /NCGR_PEP_ID=MMETSP0210-20121227/1743_1 /TAXON_ID=40633 /ORGANISM="Condylostoma magnum, Strain COL2" /LENGTH=73 /DNA_ID=CAMNT_0008269599 /DNA_START=3984 /DNA_END=4205 /DNA_ORIENTATION=-
MELASLDINIVQIVKAFQADVKDEEGVRNYQDAKKEETTKIFKLKKTDDSNIDTIDPTSEATTYQNKKGHLII